MLSTVLDASVLPVPILLALVWWELRGLRSAVDVQSQRLYELRQEVRRFTIAQPVG